MEYTTEKQQTGQINYFENGNIIAIMRLMPAGA